MFSELFVHGGGCSGDHRGGGILSMGRFNPEGAMKGVCEGTPGQQADGTDPT